MPKLASIVRARLTAQQLSGPPAPSAEAVVERLLAVQAQDPRGARLAVRARSTGLLVADVEAALTDRRSLVVTWLNRGTLHLVAADDYWWLHPLTTPQLVTGNRRRLRQEGVSEAQAERGVAVVLDTVAGEGPTTREGLRERLEAARVPTAGQALAHLLLAASLNGDLVRGPMRGAEQAFVRARDWLPSPTAAVDRPEALARLARRYLAGHGPADARDLAKWAGITLGDARAAFTGACDALVTRADGLFDLADRARPAALPGPRLLGAFDPLLLGWASREPFVGPHTVVTTNGLFRACALVEGRVVGVWRLRGSTLSIDLLERVERAAVDALEQDATEVLRFLALGDGAHVEVKAFAGRR